MLKFLANKYFVLFSNKDIIQISKMFSENIILTDPNICSVGKKEVLNTTQNIFNSANTIQIDVKALYQDNRTVVAELEILIDTNEIIKIVDILKFEESDKIERITAYKM